MTRAQATKLLLVHSPASTEYEANCWIDAFEQLGMIKLDMPKSDTAEAVAQLDRKIVEVRISYLSSATTNGRLTRDGAAEIVDILTKAGFRITRDPRNESCLPFG